MARYSGAIFELMMQSIIITSDKPTSGPCRWESGLLRASTEGQRSYCSFAYSALACLKIGMSGSAFFQSVRKS
jgi:hypothetical protein